MARDTNTESELTAMWERFYGRTDRDEDATPVACPHWSPGRITMRTGCTACAADAEPSNTVIPDPNPEPEGDVIVVDQYAVCWRKGRDYWIDFASGERRPWSDLDGPVKIYRPSDTDERKNPQ